MMLGKVEKSLSSMVSRGMKATHKQKHDLSDKIKSSNFLNTQVLRTCTTWMNSLTNDTCLARSLIVLFTGWFYNNLLLIHKLFWQWSQMTIVIYLMWSLCRSWFLLFFPNLHSAPLTLWLFRNRAAVTVIFVSPGIVFPAHISLGLHVSPHIYH